MKKIKKFIEWFNGKKVNIGAFIGSVGTLLLILPIPIAPWIPEAVLIVGGMISGIGIGHKIQKGEIKMPKRKNDANGTPIG